MSRKILVGGGSGFIGKQLVHTLKQANYEVTVISRHAQAGAITWDHIKHYGFGNEQYTAVVNLAGRNVLDMLHSFNNTQFRREVFESRVNTTQTLVSAIQQAVNKPQVFIATSAIGIYPVSETISYDEDSKLQSPNNQSLEQLCHSVENAVKPIEHDATTRAAIVRMGVVLGKGGGVYDRMSLPFRLGLGGTLGWSGSQYFPWIHVEDAARIYQFIIENPQARGVFNAVAPESINNKQFTAAIASAMHRPALFFVPSPLIQLALGAERASMLLDGQKVIPKRTLDHGFKFKYPEINTAAQQVVS